MKKNVYMAISFMIILYACAPSSQQGLQTRFMQKNCKACHQKDIQGFLSKKVIHPSVKKEDCKACHRPHGVIGVVTLWEPIEARVCFNCHQKEKRLSEEGFQHPPFKEGKCSPCHEPHSSEEEDLLRHPPQGLCYTCHEKALFQQPIVHKPLLDEGGCLTCHNPHASDYKGETKERSSLLCLTCHDPGRERFRASHQGYDLKGYECLNCHDPHSSQHKGLLKTSAHKPFQEGHCEECHPSPLLATPNPPHLQGNALCLRCHKAIVEQTKALFVHEPLEKNACLSCHDPHTSAYVPLLAKGEKDLCFSCHKMEKETFSKLVVHQVVDKGGCGSCHNPHGADYSPLLKQEGKKLCTSCHPLKNFTGAYIHKPVQSEKCLNCHHPHATDTKGLTRKPKALLCYTCHLQEKVWTQRVHPHTPTYEGECLGCHLPHAAEYADLLITTQNSLCFRCHQDLLSARDEGYLHPLSQQGRCIECHDPHATDHSGSLKRPQEDVCANQGCHASILAGLSNSKVVHKPLKGKECLSCHAPHGSKIPGYLLAQPGDICLSCHTGMKADLEQDSLVQAASLEQSNLDQAEPPVIHQPVKEMACLTCHTGHFSGNRGLTKKPIKGLCQGCHPGDEQSFKTQHANLPTSAGGCLLCHEPHISKDQGLFQPVLHEPFKKKECQVCHEGI